MKKTSFILLVFAAICELNAAFASPQDVQQSHISANVPDTYKEFEKFVGRDLAKYFSNKSAKKIEIKFDLLRRGPTQSGVAYPKFYLWVVLKSNNKKLDEGAVRIAAIEKKRIEVTDFVSKSKIIKNPKAIEAIFPRALCDGIRNRAGVNK